MGGLGEAVTKIITRTNENDRLKTHNSKKVTPSNGSDSSPPESEELHRSEGEDIEDDIEDGGENDK
ncbi:hypothetical protein QJS04_geneDACA006709 [Acorus gramineus]|uniref:Uncharacterized protein n=1 Tax=Acorus gramineus TaxID=55184 RepID=A0AAV9AXU5_ACOGR|nr:hypothetical protein QJS04_geneDACA006709 [Acorus gramineus]